MKLCRTSALAGRLPPQTLTGVTIGNFDGMHLGHQALLERLRAELAAIDQGSPKLHVLATFYPHPRRVLQPQAELRELTPLREKLRLSAAQGIDVYYAVHFTPDVAQLSPRSFIEEYVVRRFGAHIVVVGHDWTFGARRSGNTDTLRQLAEEFKFRAVVVEPVTAGGERVSSSRVRRALEEGRLDQAQELLGRRHSLTARVVHGNSRGAKLGFPTANQRLASTLLPRFGVYATRAFVGGRCYPAVTNIGSRPTVDGTTVFVETHCLTPPAESLYGKVLRIELLEFIRPEQRFASVDELRRQITRDCEAARRRHAQTAGGCC